MHGPGIEVDVRHWQRTSRRRDRDEEAAMQLVKLNLMVRTAVYAMRVS